MAAVDSRLVFPEIDEDERRRAMEESLRFACEGLPAADGSEKKEVVGG